ncbi:MAG TPA: triose-phosphate isomerase [Gammaproteobacteria bacterium]|nr:triose-phosphate isomerase [Gammaproteobacteria bacterium]
MRRALVAGNWKMNGSLESASELAEAIAVGTPTDEDIDLVVCPPFVHIPVVKRAIGEAPVELGAQNVCDQDTGSFTGEVAASMLAELGLRYALVGHSERRSHYAESDELVAARFAAAKRAGLIPILCVGETLEERDRDATESVLRRQLDAVFGLCGDSAFRDAVIAYEPVWAIGTGRTATPDQAQSAHAFLRGLVAGRDAEAADAIRLLYGGSMKPENAAELIACEDVDGGLIGGASLKADSFLAICEAAAAR